jgi:hypothetical protein
VEKVKVRFVKNLKFYAGALCLYWVDEIHVDESLKDSPALDDIIRHEMKHYEIAQRIIASKPWVKALLLLYNNFWDKLSCFKIRFKHFRQFKLACLLDFTFFSLVVFAVIYLLKVIF